MISILYLFEDQKERDILKVGIIGYSAKKFDKNDAIYLINKGLDYFKVQNGDELVSGLTDLGIPGLSYRIGRGRRLKLIGIACERAHDEDSICYPVDEEIIVGENWGDESQTFLDYIDCLIKVGGGPQSEKEYSSFNGPKIEYPLEAE